MDLEAQVKVTKPGAVENQPNGLLGVGRGFGVGRETDRQRVLHPVIASEAWQSAYALPHHKRTTAQRGFAVLYGPPRSPAAHSR